MHKFLSEIYHDDKEKQTKWLNMFAEDATKSGIPRNIVDSICELVQAKIENPELDLMKHAAEQDEMDESAKATYAKPETKEQERSSSSFSLTGVGRSIGRTIETVASTAANAIKNTLMLTIRLVSKLMGKTQVPEIDNSRSDTAGVTNSNKNSFDRRENQISKVRVYHLA